MLKILKYVSSCRAVLTAEKAAAGELGSVFVLKLIFCDYFVYMSSSACMQFADNMKGEKYREELKNTDREEE